MYVNGMEYTKHGCFVAPIKSSCKVGLQWSNYGNGYSQFLQAQLYVNVDFPSIIGWRVIAKVNWNLKHRMHWCGCHYAVFWWKVWIGLEFWHLEINQKSEGFASGVRWWLSILCRESKHPSSLIQTQVLQYSRST